MNTRFSSFGVRIAEEQSLIKKIERKQTLKQLEILTMFLPNEVINHHQSTSHRKKNMVGAVLYLDIFGLVTLSEKYDKVVNGGMTVFLKVLKYSFGSIIETITFYGGDVVKFTEDTLLAMWKVMPESCLVTEINTVLSCAIVLQEIFQRYTKLMNVRLRAKVVVSCGNIQCAIIGNEHTKALAITGDSLDGLTTLSAAIDFGEIIISNFAFARISKEHYNFVQLGCGVKILRVKHCVTEGKLKAEYVAKYVKCMTYVDAHKWYMANDTKRKALSELLTKIPGRECMRYVPQCWTVEELMPFATIPTRDYIVQWQPIEHLSAKHVVNVQSTSIVFESDFNCKLPSTFLDLLFQDMCEQMRTSLGVLTKFNILDNEMNFVAIFGLIGLNREFDSLNALRSAYKMLSICRLQKEIKTCSISVTQGRVFCCVMGHPLRKEYLVFGEIVGKTRAIHKVFTDKVSCDYNTYTYCKLASFYFQILPGDEDFAEDFGHIFEYDERGRKQIDKYHRPSLFGREGIYNVLRTLIFFPEKITMYYGVCLHGIRYIGKSAIIRRLIYDVQNGSNVVHASIELFTASKIPYFTISRLYNQIYDQVSSIVNNDIQCILNLPRSLHDMHRETMKLEEDISFQKFRILNYFRDLVLYSADKKVVVIIIDNVEFIDLQSWEILLIALADGFIRLVCSASFSKTTWDLKFQISLNEHIKLYELSTLSNEGIVEFVCGVLNVLGVSKDLVNLACKKCNRIPGIISSCLLRVLNKNKLLYHLVENFQRRDMLFVPNKCIPGALVPGCSLTDSNMGSSNYSSIGISVELYESLDLFLQLILKTASVLGDLFPRSLLTIAMKYPSELKLLKAIKYLFDEEIFECGSRYIYSDGIFGKKLCCRCYFPDDFFAKNSSFAHYAYCRLIYFRRTDLLNVCYELFPENHRKELHKLASNFIEKSITLCNFCLRNPAYRFIYFYSYKTVVETLTNPVAIVDVRKSPLDESRMYEVQQVIRNSMILDNMDPADGHLGVLPSYEKRLCNCFEMCIRAYQDIIYHCEKADMLSKQVFFSTLSGIALIMMRDIMGAKPILEKAALICTSSMDEDSCGFPKKLRHFLMGRIELSLSKIAMALHKFDECKSHLAIALRQYNIPMVTLFYKPFKKFLARSHLIKEKTSIKQYVYTKHVLLRYDMACCLCFAAKVLMAEGHTSFGKLSAAYSIHLFKSVNPNVPILLDVYTSGDFAFKNSASYKAVIKMQKITLRELQDCYANGSSYVLFSIGVLLENMFVTYYNLGKCEKAIRIGYRVLNINQRFFTRIASPDLISSMIILLGNTFRILEAANLMRLIKENSQLFGFNSYFYAVTNLIFFLRCGIGLDSVDESVAYIAEHFGKMTFAKYPLSTLKLDIILHIYYIRCGKYEMATKFDVPIDLKASLKATDYYWAYLLKLESNISFMLYNRRVGKTNGDEERVIKRIFEIVQKPIEKDAHYLLPVFLMYQAWYAQIKGNNRKAKRLLKKSHQISVKHGNLLNQAYAIQLHNCWYGGFTYDFNKSDIDYRIVSEYTVAEWAQILYGYPIN